MKEQKWYNVGIYCRLSKDDDIHGGESASIGSQKEIIGQYVKEKNWKILGDGSKRLGDGSKVLIKNK